MTRTLLEIQQHSERIHDMALKQVHLTNSLYCGNRDVEIMGEMIDNAKDMIVEFNKSLEKACNLGGCKSGDVSPEHDQVELTV